MAHARKQDSGRWQGVARHASGRQSTKVFPLKRQAVDWAEEIEAGWRQGSVRDPRAGRLTLGEWYDLWIAARTVAQTTAERERRCHNKLVLPHWRAWPLETITRIEVRAWVARMVKDGTSPREVQMAFYALSGILRDATDEDPPLILANPCARVPLPKLPPAPERFFSPEEFAACLAHMPEPWRTMADLSAWTGLRWEELAGLHGREVDWLRATLRVANVRTKFGDRAHAKTNSSHRTVPIPPWVIEAMARLMEGRHPTARVFEHKAAPCVYASWHWHWKRACALAGVEYAPPHTLRHTAASWLTEEGVDQYRIGALLGHGAGARATARYSHLRPDAHEPIRAAWATVAEQLHRRSTADLPPGEGP